MIMEQLQLAHMLADLSSTMEATEKKAAMDLVSANKEVAASSATGSDPTKPGSQNDELVLSSLPSKRLATAATSTPASSHAHDRLDVLGLRFPLSRPHSASNSAPGTPRNEPAHDDDVERAKSLMALSDIRARLRDQDSTSLLRAREKVKALAARQHQQQRPQPQRAHSASLFQYPRSDK